MIKKVAICVKLDFIPKMVNHVKLSLKLLITVTFIVLLINVVLVKMDGLLTLKLMVNVLPGLNLEILTLFLDVEVTKILTKAPPV